MTYPVGNAPEQAWQLGGRFGQDITEDSVLPTVTNTATAAYVNAQDVHRTQVTQRIDGAYTAAASAQGSADSAVTTAQAAANAATSAESTASDAYKQASYWEAEFVVASAAVVLGVNELLIGLCQNVPTGLNRRITDMHVALLSQPAGMSFDLMKWDSSGTTSSTLGSYTLTANQTRVNWSIVGGYSVANKERVWVNVTSVTGSTAPVVLQILLFGVLYDPTIQNL